MSTTFHYKYFLSILLLLSFGLNAKSASAKRANRNQRTLAKITRTITQINQQYHEPLTVLRLNNQALLANSLVTQAKQDYWFFRFARSGNALKRHISKLRYFSHKAIFNQGHPENQALLIQVNQTIRNLELLVNCLATTPEYAKEINRYIKLRHFGLFVGATYLFITSIVYFFVATACILCVIFAPIPSYYAGIGIGYLAVSVISLYAAIKCQKVRKKDHYLESNIV